MIELRRRSGKAVATGSQEEQRRAMLKGFGDFRLIGDPDYIAGELIKLSQAGADGVAMIFVNQLRDLPFFLDEVEPRLKRAGLRG